MTEHPMVKTRFGVTNVKPRLVYKFIRRVNANKQFTASYPKPTPIKVVSRRETASMMLVHRFLAA